MAGDDARGDHDGWKVESFQKAAGASTAPLRCQDLGGTLVVQCGVGLVSEPRDTPRLGGMGGTLTLVPYEGLSRLWTEIHNGDFVGMGVETEAEECVWRNTHC